MYYSGENIFSYLADVITIYFKSLKIINRKPGAANRRKENIKKVKWHTVNWKRRQEMVCKQKVKKNQRPH
jgi:hypothetical protein